MRFIIGNFPTNQLAVETYPTEGRAWINITDRAMFAQFHTLLRQGLNTRAESPKWLFDLCDTLEINPIPKVEVRDVRV